MAEIRVPTCSSCKYFERKGPVVRDPGDCRFNPPSVLIATRDGPAVVFPPTYPNFWCGQWHARLEH